MAIDVVKKYVTSDGRKWTELEKAQAHEAMLEKEKEIQQARAMMEPKFQAFCDAQGIGEGIGRSRVMNILHAYHEWQAAGVAQEEAAALESSEEDAA